MSRFPGKDFFSLNMDDLLTSYREDADGLEDEGFQNALELFQEAAIRVPAYKDFLRKHDVKPRLIKTKEDFRQIPVVDKKNYLRRYPLHELCWDGKLDGSYIVSSSSGSTGEPFLWPRGEEQELEGAIDYEVILKDIFEADKYRTLFVINFAMGAWIAGSFVLACVEHISQKGYPITAITPGIDMDVSLALIKRLGASFDQIVLAGYPPLIKDFIEKAQREGFDWKAHRVRLVFAAEGFSENFRDLIHDTIGIDDPLTGSVNIYGAADAGNLACETPLTTCIRRLISDDPHSLGMLFGDSRVPTLAQYDPRMRYFESLDDGSLIFTARTGIPLIRYSVGDTGGLYSFEDMGRALASIGHDVSALLDKQHEKYLWRLPFLYIFGRRDFTVTLYGILIYPEHLKYGLERAGLAADITGKFVMSAEYTAAQDQYLLIKVELALGAKSSASLAQKVQKAIIDGLRTVNSEYTKFHDVAPVRAVPVIELIEHGDERYFNRGAKQRWTKNKDTR